MTAEGIWGCVGASRVKVITSRNSGCLMNWKGRRDKVINRRSFCSHASCVKTFVVFGAFCAYYKRE